MSKRVYLSDITEKSEEDKLPDSDKSGYLEDEERGSTPKQILQIRQDSMSDMAAKSVRAKSTTGSLR